MLSNVFPRQLCQSYDDESCSLLHIWTPWFNIWAAFWHLKNSRMLHHKVWLKSLKQKRYHQPLLDRDFAIATQLQLTSTPPLFFLHWTKQLCYCLHWGIRGRTALCPHSASVAFIQKAKWNDGTISLSIMYRKELQQLANWSVSWLKDKWSPTILIIAFLLTMVKTLRILDCLLVKRKQFVDFPLGSRKLWWACFTCTFWHIL